MQKNSNLGINYALGLSLVCVMCVWGEGAVVRVAAENI